MWNHQKIPCTLGKLDGLRLKRYSIIQRIEYGNGCRYIYAPVRTTRNLIRINHTNLRFIKHWVHYSLSISAFPLTLYFPKHFYHILCAICLINHAHLVSHFYLQCRIFFLIKFDVENKSFLFDINWKDLFLTTFINKMEHTRMFLQQKIVNGAFESSNTVLFVWISNRILDQERKIHRAFFRYSQEFWFIVVLYYVY